MISDRGEGTKRAPARPGAMAFAARPWVKWTLGALGLLLVLVLVAVAAFPVGMFRESAERELSERFGRPVTIGALERTPALSFTPTIHARDIRIPQAGWAGRGDLARIADLSVRIRALQLLTGRVDPQAITAQGVRLDLVRAADGRENWRTGRDGGSRGPLRLDGLTVRDAAISYRDLKQDRRFTVAVTADDKGVEARGTGVVRGAAVRIAAAGPAITDSTAPWPFDAMIDGPALAISVKGTMDAPLDTDRMTLAMTARASDLKLIDAVIEAGLFGTRPVRLSADVRRDGPVWKVTALKGNVGQSDIAGHVTADKSSGRTRLDGEVRSRRLDFDDLADDAGRAAAIALERREGLKLVPNTRVDIGKITSTDGRIAFRVDRIVSARRPSSLTSASGVLTLDRQLLTVEPLRVGLAKGTITGKVTVDQRGGRAAPIVTLALDMTDSSIAALAGGGEVSGRVDGRVRLTGTGETIRAAVGRSTGTIGIVARDGALPAKIAALLGFDAGRALTADDTDRARLRCAVMRLEVASGRGRFAPLIVDTSASQTRGTGGVAFPAETIAATLTGAPKRDSILRVPGSATAGGTLRNPSVTVPPEVKSAGNILKGIGRAIAGKQGPTAGDADCAALSRQAIGR
ncbi:AsmA family protein [Sphingomonas sp.]|uniref:AsmA family protein n=1 Tax=Sphingomonas sp. TaxID=28214 RepID=UPI002DD61D1C|nr:AsmA family protein [Sphingomonas sp.]